MKKKSALGLVSALLSSAYAAYWWATINGYIGNTASSGTQAQYAAWGYAIVKTIMQDFVTFCIVAAAIALLSYFASFRFGYLISTGCLVYAYTTLPSTASPVSELALMLWGLCIFLVISFAIDQGLQNHNNDKNLSSEDSNTEIKRGS